MKNTKIFHYLGYDNIDNFKTNLIKQYIMIKKDPITSVFFDNNIFNVTDNDLAELSTFLNFTYDELSLDVIKDNLNKCIEYHIITNFNKCFSNMTIESFSKIVLDSINKLVEYSKRPSTSELKNEIYKIFMMLCIKYNFAFRNILCVKAPTYYDFCFLYILASCDCKVVIVNCSNIIDDPIMINESFATVIQGTQFGEIDIDFDNIDITMYDEEIRHKNKFLSNIKLMVKVVNTTQPNFIDNVLLPRSKRLKQDSETIPVYNVAFVGYLDIVEYNNFIFHIKDNIQKSAKPLLFLNERLPFINKDLSLIEDINDIKNMFATDNFKQSSIIENALDEIINSVENLDGTSQEYLFNLLLNFYNWFNDINKKLNINGPSLKEDIPIIIFYKEMNIDELRFLHFISRCGYDVCFLSTNTKYVKLLEENNYQTQMQVFKMPYSQEDKLFPTAEIDEPVVSNYSVDTEDIHFKTTNIITLNHTFDEIKKLWKTESRCRPYFDIQDDVAYIPTIFAKIKGISGSDIDSYWSFIRSLLGSNTQLKIVTSNNQIEFSETTYAPYWDGFRFNIPKLKLSKINPYKYMDDSIQTYIFAKMQKLYDEKFIVNFDINTLPYQILFVGLNLDKKILKALQNFDLTRTIPKYIFIDNTDFTFNVQDCILISLINLLGFDVLICSPNGYDNIEQFINNKKFCSFQFSHVYNGVKIPSLKPIKASSKSLFNKFFKNE